MESPYLDEKFHGIPWNYGSSMEGGVTRNSMEFHGILGPPNRLSPSSIEFHGIQWNSGAAMSNSIEFNWTLRLLFQLTPGFPKLLWNSMKITFRLTSGSSWSYMEYSMEFHETLASTNQISPSSMGFHGTRRAPFQMTQSSMEFHGTLVLSDQKQLSSIEFHGTSDYCFNHYQNPLDFHVIFHGIHGTLQSPN